MSSYCFSSSLYPPAACEDVVSDSFSDTASIISTSPSTVDHSTTSSARPLTRGIYVPTVCFFDPVTEDLDLTTLAQHVTQLATSGVAGIAVQGSNGEAVHLTAAERRTVTRTARTALASAGFPAMPIIAGCGAQSTRETIELCRDAANAGADYALILPPAYYRSLHAQNTLRDYFVAVADASPIPLIIYNYPAGAGGVDLDSDTIVELAHHSNIVGVKLTCGNTGKMARIVAATRSLRKSNNQAKPELAPEESLTPETLANSAETPAFLVLAGSADFTVQSLSVGAHGILGGLANISPKACIQIQKLHEASDYAGARAVQEVVARGDWTAIKTGVVGVKAGMQSWLGYGGFARSPLPRPQEKQMAEIKAGFEELVTLERTL
ncbi:putative 4-hydroxy-2-oxoglutarate aldolase mitochondrial [Ceratocystis platani]|uniref:Putative 4-hydroxy-2-oxoglutarate aldolase mitochondrial n=1 Tax=Ceratocystis fimbriata f. sp. platani TaxID=88771 RepID=A0A0F8CTK8_CERFI|nr:putative 4-hydroxy-2-oxoglutarate aldolase mitochondrial [Ceratocystis platani]